MDCFQVAAGLLAYQVTVQILLSFFEYLHQNPIGTAQLQNYLTAIRALHIVHGVDTIAFRDERLPLFLKVLKVQAPFKLRMLAHFRCFIIGTNYLTMCAHSILSGFQTPVSIYVFLISQAFECTTIFVC